MRPVFVDAKSLRRVILGDFQLGDSLPRLGHAVHRLPCVFLALLWFTERGSRCSQTGKHGGSLIYVHPG